MPTTIATTASSSTSRASSVAEANAQEPETKATASSVNADSKLSSSPPPKSVESHIFISESKLPAVGVKAKAVLKTLGQPLAWNQWVVELDGVDRREMTKLLAVFGKKWRAKQIILPTCTTFKFVFAANYDHCKRDKNSAVAKLRQAYTGNGAHYHCFGKLTDPEFQQAMQCMRVESKWAWKALWRGDGKHFVKALSGTTAYDDLNKAFHQVDQIRWLGVAYQLLHGSVMDDMRHVWCPFCGPGGCNYPDEDDCYCNRPDCNRCEDRRHGL